MADKPYYPHKPIASIDSLAKTLGVLPQILRDISERVSDSYTEFEIQSNNGKSRTVYDPKYELKRLQKRINSRIFELVEYPKYLQGGIKDEINKRDYVNNALIHSSASTLVSVDIKKFFDNIRPEYVNNIFKYFFKFPDDVTSVLTKLVVLGNKVPQGACTSTYIANLLLFNSEYQIVSALRSKNISYSRLLDDVTISSEKTLTDEEITLHIRSIVGMFLKYDLKLNNGKTKVEHRKHTSDKNHFKVTGLWVGNNEPRLRRSERNYIRQLVYACEKSYECSPCSEDYHALWNRTSGLIAKMKRLGHNQSKKYRVRLNCVLPKYDEEAKKKLVHLVRKLLRANKKKRDQIGFSKQLGKVNYQLGILGRTDDSFAKSLRTQLKKKYSNIPTQKEHWL